MNNDRDLVKMFLAGMAWERRKGDKPAIKQAIKDAMSQTRSAAQLLRAPDQTEQKCPYCDGDGYWQEANQTFWCDMCNGTGISNRSVGG